MYRFSRRARERDCVVVQLLLVFKGACSFFFVVGVLREEDMVVVFLREREWVCVIEFEEFVGSTVCGSFLRWK